ncbi:LysR family transcriptional regulator [Actinomycetospora endophytica]|uniref:LysR family transcriptional regulator n=1 Tax=Actinomycetospora endophytica TaxID=2291215 RepID=A0ABS8PA67_9PSEU|nr:LysR family transcriptional regulator [Actinomycetospora endophytica]MCD2193884.1 LysR family transcriptional regulator [Actinomycetospora endophytica]
MSSPAGDVHLRDLRYFVAVADAASFTRAAEALFVSQPALSKQIRALETRLGVRLLDRGAAGLVLTAEGAALLPHARRLVDDWTRVREEVRRAGTAPMLLVGLQTTVGRDLTRRLLAATREHGASMQVRLVSWSDASSGLADGSVDVAFVWLPVIAPDLETRILSREPRWVALASDHPLAPRPEVTMTDLADEPFVALPRSAGALREFWLASPDRGSPAVVAAEADTAEGAIEAVASGTGVVLLAEGNARLLARPDVVCRPVSDLAPCELAVAWRRGDTRELVRAAVAALTGATDDADAGSGPPAPPTPRATPRR